MSNEFIAKLTPSDIIQILGIIASFLTALVAIIISLVTMRQNSKMIEESSRACLKNKNCTKRMFYFPFS